MQQTQFSQDEQTISVSQKRLFVFFSSVVLALAQLGILLFGWHFTFDVPLSYEDTFSHLGLLALLYFITPIPMSLYMSLDSQRQDGERAGGTIGCIGAILAVLFEIIASFVIPIVGIHLPGGYSLTLVPLFTAFSFPYAILALAGAALGSFIGAIFRKKRKKNLRII